MIANIKSNPLIFILFGGSGDLAARKIIPALYSLFLDDWLAEKFIIIGTGRRALSDADFQNKLLEGVNNYSRRGKANVEKWNDFSKHVIYQSSDINNSDSYIAFSEKIQHYETEWQVEAHLMFYLAVDSNFFGTIAENISKNKLAENAETARIVIEKPFGHDLESAKALNKQLNSLFQEKQIYRIDHYLGKETVQNIMAFRFANAIFEPIWNCNYIEQVQISVTEKFGVEERGEYYEGAGALRDMIQNHLLQLLCFVAMEIPVNFSAGEIRNRKVDVLKSIRRISADDIKTNLVRGQYGKGEMDGAALLGYREEVKVSRTSNTETFAAIKFFIDNWRWHNVPFYVRSGKRMEKSSSSITIEFRAIPHSIFQEIATKDCHPNRLVINIQPEMNIRLQLQAKKTGLEMLLNSIDMVFSYDDAAKKQTPEAYETLLLEVMMSDQTLFMRADQVEAAWELVMPILNAWKNETEKDFPNYAAHTNGPSASDALLARDGHKWL